MSNLSQVGWTWHPSVVIGFGIWTLLYILANRGKRTPLLQQATFHLGTLVGLVALVSPLDELGDQYLFSAHMVQHLLLMLIVAPLWLIGTPGWLVDQIIPKQLESLVKRLANPVATFLVFVGVLWFWHVPSIYDVALGSEAIHIIEHLTFLGAALIGWWPIAGAETSCIPKPMHPIRVLYVVLLAVPCTALAAVITLAGEPVYSFYVTAPHIFGLSAIEDQTLGGSLMWVPTHMILVVALGVTLIKWFMEADQKDRQDLAKTNAQGTASISRNSFDNGNSIRT